MSDHDEQVRRCAFVLVEPHEHFDLDLAGLFGGGAAVKASSRWIAQAAHLDDGVELDHVALSALGSIGETQWQSRSDLGANHAAATLDQLLACGLLVSDDPRHRHHRERDDAVRAGQWRGLSAIGHARSRWSDAQHGEGARKARERGTEAILRRHGPPPPHVIERSTAQARIALPAKSVSPLDRLFERRVTCRNFDTTAMLPAAQFGAIMQRVFGAHAVVEVMPGAFGLKKANPSGGALHPLEAYLLVRRVEDVAAGLYHYHPVEHALEPIRLLDDTAAERMAGIFVAGQDYFADAPVLIALAARFGRTFWKYRNHAKAYRAITIEVGHVAQNLYLAATEAELGAYVTAAINEIDIEQAFGLEPMSEGPLAVLGFGRRGPERRSVEFDPLDAVWPPEPG